MSATRNATASVIAVTAPIYGTVVRVTGARTTEDGKTLRYLTVRTTVGGLEMNLDVSAFDTVAPELRSRVGIRINKVNVEPFNRDGKTGFNYRCATNGRGLFIASPPRKHPTQDEAAAPELPAPLPPMAQTVDHITALANAYRL